MVVSHAPPCAGCRHPLSWAEVDRAIGHCGRCGAPYDLTALEVPDAWAEGTSRLEGEAMPVPTGEAAPLLAVTMAPYARSSLDPYVFEGLRRPHDLKLTIRAPTMETEHHPGYREAARITRTPVVTLETQQRTWTPRTAVVLAAVASVFTLFVVVQSHFATLAILLALGGLPIAIGFAIRGARLSLVRLTLTDGRVLVEDTTSSKGPRQELVSEDELEHVEYVQQQVEVGTTETADHRIVPVQGTVAELSLRLRGGRRVPIYGRTRDWRRVLWVARTLERHFARRLDLGEL